MAYTCSVCGEKIEGDAIDFIDHTEAHIVDCLKKDHPEWVKGDDLCPDCLNFLKKQIKGDG